MDYMLFYETAAHIEPSNAVADKRVYDIEQLLKQTYEEMMEVSHLLGEPASSEKEFIDKHRDKLYTAYVRFYPKLPEYFEIESGWTFSKKGKGAKEVWVLDL